MQRAAFFFVFAGFFAVVLMALSPGRLHAAGDVCDQAKSTADVLACANQNHEKVQVRLQTLFEDMVRELEGAGLEAFRAAQKSWVVYRDHECAWEAGLKDSPSLRRIDELSCLTDVTHERAAYLETMLQKTEPAAGRGDDEAFPRWMNVLAQEHPDVFWHYGARSQVDLTCDNMREHIIHGLKMGDDGVSAAKSFVAVVQNPDVGRPNVATHIFDLKDDTCHSQLLMVAHAVGAAPVEGSQCGAYVDIVASQCGLRRLFWDENGFQVRSVVE